MAWWLLCLCSFNESNFLSNFSETSALSFLCKQLWARNKVLWGSVNYHIPTQILVFTYCLHLYGHPRCHSAPCIHKAMPDPIELCHNQAFPFSLCQLHSCSHRGRYRHLHPRPGHSLRCVSLTHNWLGVRPWLLLPMLNTPHYLRLSPPMFWRNSTILLTYLLLLPVEVSPLAAQAESPQSWVHRTGPTWPCT